jgi:Notch-like protein
LILIVHVEWNLRVNKSQRTRKRNLFCFIGTHCEIELDPCMSNPCSHGQCLVLTPFIRTCICEIGWTGIDCQESINECISNPCLNAGKCIDELNKYHCECLTGFTGEYCQTKIDLCSSIPCQNNGKSIIER